GTSFEYGYSGDASLPEASHHEASYQINTSPILPTPLQPVKRINLFELSVNDRGITPGLSRPAFSQDSSGRFICGTEEQDISKRHRNQLIFACVDMNPSQPDSLFASLWTYTIDDHVRDIQWIDQDRALFAIANKLIYMRIGPEFSQRDMELTYFPVFHQDLIREISVSPFNKSLVLSGGFDGSVFVTDIERLCRDMATQQQRSENNNYPVHEVVSSVLWHPDDPYLASCTTDLGRYHQFDIRTERTRRSVVIDTGRPELYCHAYKNAYEVIFGFGTGHLQLFDTRTQQTVATWKDPFQKQIGEIKLQPGYPENFVTFGEAEVTFWKQSGRDIQFWAHHCLLPSTSQPLPFYKTSGEFLYASNYLAVTDSLGTLSWYHVPM
ncbi:G-protein beta WD-40 repeat domain containing protein, partial [Balamuthia mandrillaris]